MSPRLILLRHGEVVSHQGDQPLTPAGRQQARDAGRRLAGQGLGSVRLLSGGTLRTRETAALVGEGLASRADRSAGPRWPSRCATPTSTWPACGSTW